jgi:hypothetical protein
MQTSSEFLFNYIYSRASHKRVNTSIVLITYTETFKFLHGKNITDTYFILTLMTNI